MKDAATLKQAAKILDMFGDKTADEVQAMIGSGFLFEFIQGGHLAVMERSLFDCGTKVWAVILQTVDLKKIHIVVPLVPKHDGRFDITIWFNEPNVIIRGGVTLDQQSAAKLLYRTSIGELQIERFYCGFNAALVGIGTSVNGFRSVDKVTGADTPNGNIPYRLSIVI